MWNVRITCLGAALLVAVLMFGMLNAAGETWTQTSTEDLSEGDSFFVEVDDGTLKLSHTLVETWGVAGEGSSDNFGVSVASAGDVNGDGYDDVIVGAHYDNGQTGMTYVWHGSASGLSPGTNASDADWSIAGEGSSDCFGYSVASAGDVNGDGYDDVIVCAYNDNSGTGKTYVWHGSASGLSPGTNASDADWSIAGEGSSDYFGYSVASAGDVNGDGYDDVIVGAYYDNSGTGKTYVWHGSASGLSPGTDAGDADWSIAGEGSSDFFGYSVASAGNVNGDGYDDIIVGAYHDSSQTGKAYVWQGSASGLSSGTNASDADWSIAGEGSNDYFGYRVASAGDVNGNGYDDIIVGAYIDNSATGKTYVWHGSASGLSSGTDAGDADWSIAGEGTSDYFGHRVASAGDVNGDGYDDIIVGAYRDNSYTGKAYVWHGHGYMRKGMYESPVFDVGGTESVDWLALSWDPVKQPDGTNVKAQIATSNDGIIWYWRGPDGSITSYYTQGTGQPIYSGEHGKYLKVRFYLESDFGEGGDVIGNMKTTRTPSITDFTVTYGRITSPTVTLHSPNGGEDLIEEGSHIVTWTADGDLNGTPIQVFYSTDGGTTWNQDGSWMADTGHYNWSVPSVETATGLVRVSVTDVYGNMVSDVSDMTFAIDPPANWQLPGSGSGDGTGDGTGGGETSGTPDTTPTGDAAETGTLWIAIAAEGVAIAVLTIVLIGMILKKRVRTKRRS